MARLPKHLIGVRGKEYSVVQFSLLLLGSDAKGRHAGRCSPVNEIAQASYFGHLKAPTEQHAEHLAIYYLGYFLR